MRKKLYMFLVFLMVVSQFNIVYAAKETDDTSGEDGYYLIQYDGDKQEVILNKDVKLVLNGWVNDSSVAAQVINQRDDTSLGEIELSVKDSLDLVNIGEDYAITYRLVKSAEFEAEKVKSKELNTETRIVTENKNGTSVERIATIDEYHTIIDQEYIYYSMTGDGEKTTITKEEYNVLNQLSNENETNGSDVEVSKSDELNSQSPSINELEPAEKNKDVDKEGLNHPAALMSRSVKSPTVSYTAHVQTYGWLNQVSNGQTGGTTGKYKRIEAIKMQLENAPYSGGIEYTAHMQTYGWLNTVSNGEVGGVTGKYKRMEAIRINLTGEMAKHYDVYYRAHTATFGWLDWAKNGERAGSEGYSKRMEAIQIKLVKKGGKAPGSTTEPYKFNMSVNYQAHTQTYGWLDPVSDGEIGGTTGKYKRMEAIKIKLKHAPYSGGIEYAAHMQTYGWLDTVSNWKVGGVTGKYKRMEAIKINLTGEMAKHYDVYYRAHTATFGWLDWAKNGERAGSEGYSKRMEAIQIKLVKKGDKAPGSTKTPYRANTSLEYSTYVQGTGWMDYVSDGETGGTTGKYKPMEAIKIRLKHGPYSGGVEYAAHVQTYGWLNSVSNGKVGGTTGKDKRMEAININLTGEMAKHYDIYYRTHLQTYGWLDWAKNGMNAGSTGLYKRIEAIQIKLVPKDKGWSVDPDKAFKKHGMSIHYTNYNLSFSKFLDIQMASGPKADGAGSLNASRSMTAYYANSNNFSKDTNSYFQFLDLSKSPGVTASQLNNSVLKGKGVLSGTGQSFIAGGKANKINEVYLVAHALHETGNGTSSLSNGSIQVGTISANKWAVFQPDGTYVAELIGKNWDINKDNNFPKSKAKDIRKIYNMFGIGAVDTYTNTRGAIRAYQEHWFSIADAIKGGAAFVGNYYINAGQNTLYKMRWGPEQAINAGKVTHLYATHAAWAVLQTDRIADVYNQLDSYTLYMDVPKFKGQPSSSSKPAGDDQYDLDTSESGKTRTTTDNLRFRSSPNTYQNNIIKTLPTGTKVTIIGQNLKWYKVKVNNQSGWVYGSYLK